MTECERIVRDGILPESYFEEEVRCDFLITSLRKSIWAIELDLLLEFDRVCKKHHLQYYLAFGTLLGAVRHRGFIPWDDDTDIVMPRKDFEKLFLYSTEFRDPYFFQTPDTDNGYFFAHPRLRNSRTCAIQRPFCDCEYNMGVFLDIIPLDDIHKDDYGRSIFAKVASLLVDSSTTMKKECRFLNERDRERVANLSDYPPLERYRDIHKLIQSMNDQGADYCFASTALVYGFDRSVLQQACFSDSVLMDFEGYSFPVPSGYDSVLKTLYGDYHQLPPMDKRGIWHGEIWFDTNRSYRDVKKDPQYQEWSQQLY